MDIFDFALLCTLHHEGGFVNHKDDPGGATNYGISLRSLRALEADNLDAWDYDGDGDVDEEDMRRIEKDDVAGFYRRHFWETARCDEIASSLISVKVFDMAVNMGPGQAVKLLQRAVGARADGKFGPLTAKAVHLSGGEDYVVLDTLRKTQADFYLELVKKRPRLDAFLLGWLRRAAQ